MKSRSTHLAFVSLVLALGIAGCSTTENRMSSTGSEMPTGRFAKETDKSVVAVINPDGTYTGTTPDGKDWVRGKYTVTGDMVAFADSWTAEAYKDTSCVESGDGTYRWEAIGSDIKLTLVNDPCSPRAEGIGTSTWKRLR